MFRDKSSQHWNIDMSVESEASNLLIEIVSPQIPGESVKALIGRAARQVGFSFSRTRKLWYGGARAILAAEMDQLRKVAGENKPAGAVIGQQTDFHSVIERMDRMDAELRDLRAELDRRRDARPRRQVA